MDLPEMSAASNVFVRPAWSFVFPFSKLIKSIQTFLFNPGHGPTGSALNIVPDTSKFDLIIP